MSSKIGTKRRSSRGLRFNERDIKGLFESKSGKKKVTVSPPLEQQIQKSIIEQVSFLRYKGRSLSYYLHHSPNGGYRNEIEGANFKRMGVQAGYPDLIMDIAKNGYHGLRIELKRSPKEKLTEYQEERLKILNEEGYYAVVCTGVDNAVDTIQKYMGII